MNHLAINFLFVLIFSGNLLSWTSALNSGSRSKAPRHNGKPGSLHRKARQAGYLRPGGRASQRNANDAASRDRDSYGPATDSYASPGPYNDEDADSSDETSDSYSAASKATAGDLAKSYEDDVVSGDLNNTSDQNLTFSGFQNLSSPVNGSHSQFDNSTEDLTPSSFQNFSSAVNESDSQLDNSTDDTSDIASDPDEASNSSSDLDPSGSLFSELPPNALQKSDLFLGFLPDDGSSGGTRQTIAQLNSQIGKKSAVYGWYAQAHSGIPFDGSQLLAIIDDVKACKCIFQPAIMPVGGWKGLTRSDNSQANAIAQVLKKFTDEGIPVWLRFAHETDGTYQGNAADFKAGWAAVAAAIKQIAPSVKMWWTPNVSTAEDYEAYEPDDMSTVDLVGIDYYPKQLKGNDFLDAMQEFHDKYAVNGRKFAIGETGLGWSGDINDKTQWFNQICEAKSSLPQFVSMAWFNFDKEYDYKIAGEPPLNQKFTALIAN